MINLKVELTEELKNILGEHTPNLRFSINGSEIINISKENSFVEIREKEDYTWVSYLDLCAYSGENRFNRNGKTSYAFETIEDGYTTLYFIPLLVSYPTEINEKNNTVILSRQPSRVVRKIIFKDTLECYSLGASVKKTSPKSFFRDISRHVNAYNFKIDNSVTHKPLLECLHSYVVKDNLDIFIKYIEDPILFILFNNKILYNNKEFVADYKNYFNTDKTTLEEILKVPLAKIKKYNINSIKEYCNLVELKEESITPENLEVLDRFSKASRNTFIEMVKIYNLDENECVEYVNNCLTYQGIAIDQVLPLLAKVFFYSKLLNEEIVYPTSLKLVANQLTWRVTHAKQTFPFEAIHLNYDQTDQVICDYLKKTGFFVSIRNSHAGMTILNVKTSGLDIVKSGDTITQKIELLNYEQIDKQLIIYKHTYSLERHENSAGTAFIPRYNIVKISKDIVYRADKKGRLYMPGSLKDMVLTEDNIFDIEEFISNPIFDKTGAKMFLQLCRDNKCNKVEQFRTVLTYLRSYQYLESVMTRGFTKEVFGLVSSTSSTPIFLPTNKTIKEHFYYYSKAQINYILSKEDIWYHTIGFHSACKMIYDCIHYLDIQIIDLIAETKMSDSILKDLFDLEILSKQNIITVFNYLKNQVELRVGHFTEVCGLFIDYTRMTKRLGYPNSRRYPDDLIKSHDVVTQAYNTLKDEMLAEDFKEVMAKYQRHNYKSEDEDYCIVVPQTVDEIVTEGVELNHCVKSYTNSIIEEKTLILFVRRKDEPETPYFTLEIRNNRINQLRGSGNCCAPLEVEHFVKKWFNEVFKKKKVAA